MRDEAFLDVEVLLYATARTDPRSLAAMAAIEAGGVTSVQVLAQFTTIALNRLNRSWPEIHEALSILKVLCPKPQSIRLTTYEIALELVQGESLSLPDALVVASALMVGCSRLVTGMAADRRVFAGRLLVCNPFGRALLPSLVPRPA